MNTAIFFFLYDLAHKSNFLDHVIIFFALWFPYVVVILAGLFLLFHHEVLAAESPFRVFMEKKVEILHAFFSGVLAWILAYALKYLFHTPRPFDAFSQVHSLIPESGYAFPSGHATFFMALAFSIFFMHKRAGYWFIFFAILIGVARIMAGVHFPIDILGGFVLGYGVSCLVAFFAKNR